jgi:hypothetical protein
MKKKGQTPPNSKGVVDEHTLNFIKSDGGDIAMNHSTINKRNGNIYLTGNLPQLEKSKYQRRKKVSVLIVLSIIFSTFLGLLSNIVAEYLQQQYDLLINKSRFLIVAIVFTLSLLVSIYFAIKQSQDEN